MSNRAAHFAQLTCSIVTRAREVGLGDDKAEDAEGQGEVGGVSHRRLSIGSFAKGAGGIIVAYAKLMVEAPADTLLTTATEISRLQTELALEPVGRGLTDAERETLKPIFSASLHYDEIVIKEGFAGIFMLAGEKAITVQNTVYMKSKRETKTLLHEVMHIWQHQNGGTDYKIWAVVAQATTDEYEWQPAVDAGERWSALNPEFQAELVEDAYVGEFF